MGDKRRDESRRGKPGACATFGLERFVKDLGVYETALAGV